MKHQPRYVVGIDLGTSHCALAYADLTRPQAGIQVLEIDQLVAPGEWARLPLFPSCRYHPFSGEFPPADIELPWQHAGAEYGEPVSDLIQGQLARHLSGKSLGRSVTSAKSWLGNAQVDREAAILPWGGVDDVEKVSPLVATAGYLHYLRSCWDRHHPDEPLARQYVVLTIPASFDEDARQYTLEAAELAGVPVARLLEEPTAAFYAWYWSQPDFFRGDSEPRTLLVCDIGGGTLDLTLVRITPQGDLPPLIERIGVGEHLLLGGDNMDLAIAHMAESSFGGTLSASVLQQLAEESRRAKEICLGSEPPEEIRLTLLGGGSRLIGGSRSVSLSTERMRRYLLESFFPEMEANAELDETPARATALVTAGLPYERDPAMTRHLLRFLRRFKKVLQASGDESGIPGLVLFNGGVFNSALLRGHVLNLLGLWRGQPVQELSLSAPDLSVAMGATVHGLAMNGHFHKVTGGSSRHYFLLVEDQAGESVGVCLLPKGTSEAVPLRLADRRFLLTTGQTVAFRIATSTRDESIALGELRPQSPDWNLLPPLIVRLEESQGGRAEYEVQLEAELTEVGVLQLLCVDVQDPSRGWRLEFHLRQSGSSNVQAFGAEQHQAHPRLPEARQRLSEFFASRSLEARALKGLRGDLEQLLGEREQWGLGDIRELADYLLSMEEQRRRSPIHERAWLHWTGFCLRPGLGHPLDQERLDQLAPFQAEGPIHVRDQAVWAEWWNLWRRIAAGLPEQTQRGLLQDAAYYLHPSNARSRKRQAELAERAYDDLVRMLGGLEELSPDAKLEAGGWLFERLRRPGESPHTWWALGRLGARVLFSGRRDRVVPPDTVRPWLLALLKVDWRKQRVAALAATLMARMSGDRALDIDTELHDQVIQKLRQAKAPERWLHMVREVVELEREDQGSLFGESLPSGLVLIEHSA